MDHGGFLSEYFSHQKKSLLSYTSESKARFSMWFWYEEEEKKRNKLGIDGDFCMILVNSQIDYS